MKLFRKSFVSCCIVVLLVSLLLVPSHALSIAADTKSVAAGDQSVTVALTLSDNKGIAGGLLSVSYDSALKLTKVEGGSALSTLTFTPGGDLSANPIRLLWDGQDADSSNGTIALLTFAVPDKSGDYKITLAADSQSFFDNELKDVAVSLTNGTVTVTGGTNAATTDPTKPDTTTTEPTPTDPTKPDTTTTEPTPSDPGTTGQQGGESTASAPKFADVADNSWYHDAVAFVSQKGLMSGTSATTFSPNNPMTRAMLMTVLARYAGVDTSGGSTWYEKGMNWAKQNGISDGSNPSGNITREQLATMLYRYAQTQGKGFVGAWAFLLDFPDRESVHDWAYESMCWMTMNKVITGMGDGTLNPQGSATRAQVATMLMRFVSLG